MIPIYAADLVDKISTVAALGERVGTTLGGSEADPTLAQVETPAVWVVFQGSQPSNTDHKRFQLVRLNFAAVLILDYGQGESDFVNTQLALIEEISQAVRGEISGSQGSMLWGFDGVRLISMNPDRVVYEMSFSADAAYAKQLS